MRKYSMRDWSEADQPRMKLLQQGPASLSDTELLAILINHGTMTDSALDLARSLFKAANNDLHQLGSLNVRGMLDLRIKGLKEAKLIHIAAALELGARRQAAINKRETVTHSRDIAEYLRARLRFHSREVFGIVLLNRANKVLHFEIISEGGITGTVADPRVILKKSLEYQATALIICHNHPSGKTQPSEADKQITKRIQEAAALFEIRLLDHIIVGEEGYFSFTDSGML